jgi:flagellar hook-associated protein 1 FlgK
MNLASAARVAQSGLSSVTAEMSLVSRNIAGAGDDFASRKIGRIASTGAGSQLVAVTRASNLAVFSNVLASTAVTAAKEALGVGLDRLATTLGDLATGDASPADHLSNFTDALRAYAATPTNSSAAGHVVSTAKSLASALNSASSVVQHERAKADSDIARSVDTVNSLLARFETLNRQIVKGTVSGVDVTDVLDQRDAVLGQMANEIGITTAAGPNGDMSIYTDSGSTLFQGGRARSVTFEATPTYTAATRGNPVFVDGVPVTGNSAAMSIGSGKIAGAAALRDGPAVTYQAQLDEIAGALIGLFAESDQVGSGPDLPGLFTTPDAVALPTTTSGLAAAISVNANVDPARGGDVELLRDGGISAPGNPNYTYNRDAYASFSGRITELLDNLSETWTFAAAGGIDSEASIGGYATASVSWLSAERSRVASERDYQSVLLNTATSAFSEVAGVNLDTEMSKMLTLEQSYSASARLIAAIDDMFTALMNRI